MTIVLLFFMEEKKIRYKNYSFRLNEKTVLELAEIRKKKGISWNKLFIDLINKYVDILH